jgi:hypothetical protein
MVNPVVMVSVPAITTQMAAAVATRGQRRLPLERARAGALGSIRKRSRHCVAHTSSSAAKGAE